MYLYIYVYVCIYVNSKNDNDLETFGTGLRDCRCKESPFVNRGHDLIITGDLRFIENNHLRKLISKVPNFREVKTINWNIYKNPIRRE